MSDKKVTSLTPAEAALVVSQLERLVELHDGYLSRVAGILEYTYAYVHQVLRRKMPPSGVMKKRVERELEKAERGAGSALKEAKKYNSRPHQVLRVGFKNKIERKAIMLEFDVEERAEILRSAYENATGSAPPLRFYE